jgi:hypothetical protein
MKYYIYDESTGKMSLATSSKTIKMYKKMAEASFQGFRQTMLKEFDKDG